MDEIRRSPPRMVLKPCKWWDLNYWVPTSTGGHPPDFWWPSTVGFSEKFAKLLQVSDRSDPWLKVQPWANGTFPGFCLTSKHLGVGGFWKGPKLIHTPNIPKHRMSVGIWMSRGEYSLIYIYTYIHVFLCKMTWAPVTCRLCYTVSACASQHHLSIAWHLPGHGQCWQCLGVSVKMLPVQITLKIPNLIE